MTTDRSQEEEPLVLTDRPLIRIARPQHNLSGAWVCMSGEPGLGALASTGPMQGWPQKAKKAQSPSPLWCFLCLLWPIRIAARSQCSAQEQNEGNKVRLARIQTLHTAGRFHAKSAKVTKGSIQKHSPRSPRTPRLNGPNRRRSHAETLSPNRFDHGLQGCPLIEPRQ